MYKMPRYDRTGPMGQGPMTRRGMGYCNPNQNPDYQKKVEPLPQNQGVIYGKGRGGVPNGGGRGLGRGRRGLGRMQFFSQRFFRNADSQLTEQPLEENL